MVRYPFLFTSSSHSLQAYYFQQFTCILISKSPFLSITWITPIPMTYTLEFLVRYSFRCMSSSHSFIFKYILTLRSKPTLIPCQPQAHVKLDYVNNFVSICCHIQINQIHVNLKFMSTSSTCQPKVHVNLDYVHNFVCIWY